MATALLNGVRIAYQQLGEGPDLVFVHGLAASRAFWFIPYALPLQTHFRITLFDLRGHGYSERAPTGYGVTAMAADLGALLDHLQIARCALIGHSYGGGIALEYTCRHPERIERLALLDTKVNSLQPQQLLSDNEHLTPFEIEATSQSGHDWAREQQIGLLFLEVVARQRLAGVPIRARDEFTPFGDGRGALRNARQWIELLEQTSAATDFTELGAGAASIAGLDLPLLLMYGEYSRCLPSLRQLRLLQPHAEVTILPAAGHFFPLSHIEETRARCERFLTAPSFEHGAAAPREAAATIGTVTPD